MSESRAWIDRDPPKPDPVGVVVTDEMAETAEDAEQACASSHGGTRWPCCRRAGLAAVVPLIAERVRAETVRDEEDYEASIRADERRKVAEEIAVAAARYPGLWCQWTTQEVLGITEGHDLMPRVAAEMTTEGGHRYLSTGCLHGEHGYCASMVGAQGVKRAATCKFCDARCVCPCHGGEEANG